MFRLIATTALALAAGVATAQVTVADPWVRATVPQQHATGAFMVLRAGADTRLVEARSPVAGVVEIHEMKMDGNVMKMRAVAGIDIPRGGTVELRPGGYHVMLMDLKSQIRPDDKVPLTLVLETKDRKRETVEVMAVARPLQSGGDGTDTGHKSHKSHRSH